MQSLLAEGYKSRSQMARVVTENWAAQNIYCVSCEFNSILRTAANTRAIDFYCGACKANYQLKSGRHWNDQRIPDAGYQAMISAIKSDAVPNLLVLQYTQQWTVRNLMLVPSFFFTETAIEKRRPLSLNARRAGWVGCNILLKTIPPEGKIRIVADGVTADATVIRHQYQKARPLARLKASLRGWALNVLTVVHKIGRIDFCLRDVYAFEEELALLYPDNRNVREKIRQQLQVLRDAGLIRFMGRGQYSLVS